MEIYIIFSVTVFPIFSSYMQSNGYKPTPLDLSSIQLSKKMMDVVELLAENTHNVWARERIKQGWTYGLNEVRKWGGL